MSELSDRYHEVRERIAATAGQLSPADLARPVPACPAWSVHDLLAHVSGLPDELANGRYPQGELQAWLDSIVTARRDTPVEELVRAWAATAGRIEGIIDGSGGMLLVDVAAHEHDLLGALGRPPHRDAPETSLVVRLALGLLVGGIEHAGLGPLAVDTDAEIVASHEGVPACVLRVDGWEAFRALESRRTADELRALPHDGDIAAFVAVIDAHSPLPARSLGEA